MKFSIAVISFAMIGASIEARIDDLTKERAICTRYHLSVDFLNRLQQQEIPFKSIGIHKIIMIRRALQVGEKTGCNKQLQDFHCKRFGFKGRSVVC